MEFAIVVAIICMIALPMTIKIVDEQLGYFFLAIGGVMLAYSINIGLVSFSNGAFVQLAMKGGEEHLIHIIFEPKILLAVFLVLKIVAHLLRHEIAAGINWMLKRIQPAIFIAIWVLLIGSAGSLSVVVMAALGGTFFVSLQKATKKRYTAAVVVYSANIGISALLLPIGEPLSLFIAKNLEVNSVYLLKTFGGIVAVNSALLCVLSYVVARWFSTDIEVSAEDVLVRDLKEVERSVDRGTSAADEETIAEVHEAVAALRGWRRMIHNFPNELDAILHSTTKLAFFVYGLLLFGVAAKSIAYNTLSTMSPNIAFWGNSLSAVADNALLGLLEVLKGMPQGTVLILGVSLAFWGVGLVPGNVCNVVLKEDLEISFKEWARYGLPLALFLSVFNLFLIKTGIIALLIIPV